MKNAKGDWSHIDWHPQSPDLSPTEGLWDVL